MLKKSRPSISWCFYVLLMGIASAMTFFLYLKALNGPFQFDDISYIKNNPYFSSFDEHYLSSVWQYYPSRFIGFLTFFLNHQFSGWNPYSWHVVNVGIHILNAMLTFWLTHLILKSPKMHTLNNHKATHIIPFGVALLFLVHPIQTQSVSYIYQRLTSLATCFYLLSLCCYAQWRWNQTTNNTKLCAQPWKNFLCVLLFFVSAVLAMMTKEISFTLPIMVFLLEVFFYSERWQDFYLNRSRRILLAGLLLLGLIIPFLLKFDYRTIFLYQVPSGSHLGDTINVYTYALTQPGVILYYLKLWFFPYTQNFYYDFSVSTSFFDYHVLGSLCIILIILFSAKALYTKYTMISFGICWFFVSLLVESSVIPIRHVIWEHRLYLPCYGLCLGVVSSLFYLKKRRHAYMIFGLIVCVLSFLTFQRNSVWATEIKLWEDVVRKSPNKPRAHNNLAISYLKNKQYDEALKHFNTTIDLTSGQYRLIYYNRGSLYLMTQQPIKAIQDFSHSLQMHPDHVSTYIKRGIAYRWTGQQQRSLEDFNYLITKSKAIAKGYHNRGKTYEYMGLYQEAMQDYIQAYEINPRLNGLADDMNRITNR